MPNQIQTLVLDEGEGKRDERFNVIRCVRVLLCRIINIFGCCSLLLYHDVVKVNACDHCFNKGSRLLVTIHSSCSPLARQESGVGQTESLYADGS